MWYFFAIISIQSLLMSPAFSQLVVIDAKPTARVESDANSTVRSVLSKADQDKYRVRIAKQGNRYLWLSRENRELLHQATGAVHYFIDPRGGGYIKVFDTTNLPESTRDTGPRYRYIEHLSFLLGTITYWGATDAFEP